MALKSTVRPMRIPTQPNAMDPDGKVDLPTGWSLNETNEILNEEGLVMMDIQEELPSEKITETTSGNTHPSPVNSSGTIPVQSTSTSSHQLPAHISQLLDQLELEEQELQRIKDESDRLESAELDHYDPSAPDFITPTDLDEEIGKQLNPPFIQAYQSTEDKELKSWGKTGLEGLKNIFKSSSQPIVISSEKPKSSTQTPSAVKVSSEQRDQDSHSAPTPPNSRPKKSVTFAPDTYLPSESEPAASSDLLDRPQPSPGIILSDIVEHPLPQPTPSKLVPTSKTTAVNGKNAHLNPRLASLLPQSLQHKSNFNSSSTEQDDHDEVTEQEDEPKIDDDDDDESSTWSYEDYEEEGGDGASWPPDDLDIQTALDLRQAALEYHTKRQGLGLGKETGPLGGEGPPHVDDDEREWVPIETRVQAPGVPREPNGQSRFKTGRNLKPLDPNHSPNDLNETKVIDGKLFGTQPIVEGPSPTLKGAAIYEIPGRKANFTELDDELTAEEMELLRSRLEALGMDEESRLAAERAGSELMEWMERARRGELVDDDVDDEQQDYHDNNHLPPPPPASAPGIFPSKAFVSSVVEEKSSCYPPRNHDGPPEIKTAPKSHLPSIKSKLQNASSRHSLSNQSLQPNDTSLSTLLSSEEIRQDTSPSKNSQNDDSFLDDNQRVLHANERSSSLKNNHQLLSSKTNTTNTTTNDINAINTKPIKKMSRFKSSKIHSN